MEIRKKELKAWPPRMKMPTAELYLKEATVIFTAFTYLQQDFPN